MIGTEKMDGSIASAASTMCGSSKNSKKGGDERSSSTAAMVMRKGPWTEEEDAQLVWFVRLFGERRWDFLAKVSGLRGGGCTILTHAYPNPIHLLPPFINHNLIRGW